MAGTVADEPMSDDANDLVVVRVFGGMGIDAAEDTANIGGPRQRRLLALLALRAGSGVSIDWLAEHLWVDEDRPDDPTPAVRTYVSRLRQVLPDTAQAWLATEPGGYRFDAPDGALEHRRFQLLRTRAATARADDDPLAALHLLDEALALWRGAPFEELDDVTIAAADISQLELDRLEMLEERWECSLALGRHTQITGALAVFTDEHPDRDRATRQYALALHRSGRTPEALRVISSHRDVVADASGLDPSAEMVELERRILAGDPSLNVVKIGRPLRGYRLLDEIGNGAFSIVWRASQPSVGREVAIKQIRAELASQPEFIRRFEAEAHLVARIEHPHVVPLVDFWRDPDSAYLVMGLMRGGTLERRLDDGPLDVDSTLTLAGQIGGALAAAHDRGVVHRDVKPGNIFFDEAGHGFLGDFGIALRTAESTGPEAAFSTGSPAYSAPEQLRREPLGPQTDVFSLGVVLFESLTGTLPFADSASLSELVERQLNVDYPEVIALRPDVPIHVSRAIAKATSKQPDDRFATVAEFVGDLNRAGASAGGDATPLALPADLPNPYLGLRSFDEADQENYFGREGHIASLVARLGATGLPSRCIGLIGPSGSGKSSLVRAGLSPAIHNGSVPGSHQWLSTTMVPGNDPYEALEAALLRIAVNPPPSLLEQLRDGRRGLLRCLRRCLADDAHKIYLVIDQFEELFTSPDEQTAFDFLDALAVAVEDPQSPLRLVFTLRADYYDRPLGHPTFAAVLDAATVNITPLSAGELEDAITQPAHRVGVGFEPGLVASLLADCVGQAAPLPLLQYALTELFERRDGAQITTAAYDAMGRLSGALAGRAESMHHRADDAQRAAMRRTFGQLANPTAQSADLRRRVAVGDLGDDAATAWVLDQFGDARLLTFDRDRSTREPTVEVSHEALLREWPRLVGWLGEDAEVLRSVDAVSLAATEWDRSGRPDSDLYRGPRLASARGLQMAAADRLRPVDVDFIDASQAFAESEDEAEQRRLRRLRRLVVSIGAALVLALVAGAVALAQQQRASNQTEIAQNEARRAEAQTRLAETEATNAEIQAQIAENEAANAEAQARNAETQARNAELANLISASAAQSIDNPELALLLALEANRREPGALTERAVLNAIGSSAIPNRISSLPLKFRESESCDRVQAPSDLLLGAVGLFEGLLAARDSLSGAITTYGPPPPDAPSCVQWDIETTTGRRWVGSTDGRAMWSGPSEGVWDVEREFDEQRVRVGGFVGTDRVLYGTFADGQPRLHLVDLTTGEDIGGPILGGEQVSAQAVSSPDGSLIAASYIASTEQGTGLTQILDGETGEELLRLETEAPFVRLALDQDASELVAAGFDNTITTFDIETGAVIAVTTTSAPSSIVDIAVRSDGLILVVAGGFVDTVDRRLGPVGEPVELRNVTQSVIRPDGLITTLSTENRLDTFDLAGSALITESHQVDPFASVFFTSGWAATVDWPLGDPTVIDLATGERSPTPLVDAQGERFAARAVSADAAGIWAVDFNSRVARFEDGGIVADVDLDGEFGFGRNVERSEDRLTVIGTFADQDSVVHLVDLASGEPELVFSIPAPAVHVAHPTLDGGVFTIDEDGTLQTFDPAGQQVAEVELTMPFGFRINGHAIAVDEVSGMLAIGNDTGAWIVDPLTGDARRLAQSGDVANVGFARNGELLVVTNRDGNVRIWEVDGDNPPAFVWNGSGAARSGSPAWYDEATESVWVASSGEVLQIPVQPQRWIERACEIVGRDLSQEEWDRYVPGGGSVESACAG